jgi:hypothetical protein
MKKQKKIYKIKMSDWDNQFDSLDSIYNYYLTNKMISGDISPEEERELYRFEKFSYLDNNY